jgi:hypothetical protein
VICEVFFSHLSEGVPWATATGNHADIGTQDHRPGPLIQPPRGWPGLSLVSGRPRWKPRSPRCCPGSVRHFDVD